MAKGHIGVVSDGTPFTAAPPNGNLEKIMQKLCQREERFLLCGGFSV